MNQKRMNSPLQNENIISGRYNWDELKKSIMQYGLRNSLLVAPMPTVSTAQITGNNESFEPINANIYTKTTLAGKFTAANMDMVKHLMELNVWNENIKNRIAADDGSVMRITEIPAEVREVYRTVWEMKQSDLITRAALRSAFIDQSQSLNIYVSDNSNAVLRAVMNKGWELGLPTGSYYIRTKPAAKALNTNLAVVSTNKQTEITKQETKDKKPICEPGCDSCAL